MDSKPNSDAILAAYYDSFAMHSEIQNVFDGLDWILRRQKFGKFVPSMLLTGGSGAGKSALIQQYVSKRMSDDEVLITRVRPTLHETLVWMVNELRVYKNHRAKGSTNGIADYAIRCLKRSNLKLLIVEECQELFECAKPSERQDIRNRLKMISDDCRLPIVFVGVPSAKLILEDSQWDRRVMVKRELPYVKLSDEASIDTYLDLLEVMEKDLPLPFDFDITDVDFAIRLLAASRGIMSTIKELFAAGLHVALQRQRKSIHQYDLIQGYAEIFGPDTVNPFSVDMDKLRIKQIESYDEYVIDPDTGEVKFMEQIFSELSVNDLLGG